MLAGLGGGGWVGMILGIVRRAAVQVWRGGVALHRGRQRLLILLHGYSTKHLLFSYLFFNKRRKGE